MNGIIFKYMFVLVLLMNMIVFVCVFVANRVRSASKSSTYYGRGFNLFIVDVKFMLLVLYKFVFDVVFKLNIFFVNIFCMSVKSCSSSFSISFVVVSAFVSVCSVVVFFVVFML